MNITVYLFFGVCLSFVIGYRNLKSRKCIKLKQLQATTAATQEPFINVIKKRLFPTDADDDLEIKTENDILR